MIQGLMLRQFLKGRMKWVAFTQSFPAGLVPEEISVDDGKFKSAQIKLDSKPSSPGSL
jgi:hypothetical protein